MDTLLTDFRYAVRALQKARGFTAVAVLTLALGIAATTTLFSVVYAVDIRRFPFVDQDRLVVVGENQTQPRSEVSYGNFRDWRSATTSFSGLAAMGSLNWSFVLRGRADPALVPYRAVSGNFFELLGAQAAIAPASRSERSGLTPRGRGP